MSHDYEGSDTEPMLRHDRRHGTRREPRFYPAVDPKYADDAPECPMCGCYRREDCKAACG